MSSTSQPPTSAKAVYELSHVGFSSSSGTTCSVNTGQSYSSQESEYSAFVNWGGSQEENFIETSKLTPSLSRSRPDRQPAVLSPPSPRPETSSAIPAVSNNYNYNTRQDVPIPIVNSSLQPTTSTSNNVSALERPLSSLSTTFQNGLSYSQPVFDNPQALAAFHGIPQFLPPAPRPLSHQYKQQQQHQHQQQPSRSSSFTSSPDLQTLFSNYSSMLKKPTDNSMAAADTTTAPTVDPAALASSSVSDHDAAKAVLDSIIASPEFAAAADQFDPDSFESMMTSPLFEDGSPSFDFLSGPLEESPFSDSLETPAMDFLNSPLIDFNEGSADFDGLLFNDAPFNPPVQKSQRAAASAHTLSGDALSQMYTMSPPTSEFATPFTPYLDTPYTPSLDTPALEHSPAGFPSRRAHVAPTRQNRKSSATGTRKNVTPASLVPIDAPTQPRKYATPSATSRKELPAVFAKKRSRSAAFGNEDDVDELNEPMPVNATEKEQIEWKRRQNTLAARKSRKRKLEHQQMLEEQLQDAERDRDEWRTRAQTYAEMLKNKGIDV